VAGAKPIAQEPVSRHRRFIERFENFNRGLNACSRSHDGHLARNSNLFSNYTKLPQFRLSSFQLKLGNVMRVFIG